MLAIKFRHRQAVRTMATFDLRRGTRHENRPDRRSATFRTNPYPTHQQDRCESVRQRLRTSRALQPVCNTRKPVALTDNFARCAVVLASYTLDYEHLRSQNQVKRDEWLPCLNRLTTHCVCIKNPRTAVQMPRRTSLAFYRQSVRGNRLYIR